MVDKAKALAFDVDVQRVRERLIVRLPNEVSVSLPSRGQVAVTGTINGAEFMTVVEPDGMKGHWISLSNELGDEFEEGERLAIELTVAKQWPEPQLPEDFVAALAAAPDLVGHWQSITPMARWEWVRWINETRNPDTRSRRIEVAISKLRAGSRRPCCFNLSACTDPELSKSGKLAI